MTLEDAVSAEERNDLVSASTEYENLLRQSPSEEIFVNALVLYWQATDYGLSSTIGLSPSFVAHAGDRLERMLEQAAGYGELAVRWARLIKHLDFGAPLFARDVHYEVSISNDEPCELAFFPFFLSGGLDCSAEIDAFLPELKTRSATMRTRYLQSVIESLIAKKASLHVAS